LYGVSEVIAQGSAAEVASVGPAVHEEPLNLKNRAEPPAPGSVAAYIKVPNRASARTGYTYLGPQLYLTHVWW
jgi:hypothetical protein